MGGTEDANARLAGLFKYVDADEADDLPEFASMIHRATSVIFVRYFLDLHIAGLAGVSLPPGEGRSDLIRESAASALGDLGMQPCVAGELHEDRDRDDWLLHQLVYALSETSFDWPEALRHRGRLQEIPEQGLSSQRALAEFEDWVRHLHDLLVELGRNIEDADQRLASGVRVKRALQEIVSTAADQRLRPQRELATLMLDAVRHVPSEDLTVRHLSAVQECADRLSETELTHEHLAACDSALLAGGLDSLPDLGDDDE